MEALKWAYNDIAAHLAFESYTSEQKAEAAAGHMNSLADQIGLHETWTVEYGEAVQGYWVRHA